MLRRVIYHLKRWVWCSLVMKLLNIIKESIYPSSKLMMMSYENLVSSRRNLQRCILVSRKEYLEKQNRLSARIEKRVKNKDGSLPTQIDSFDNRTSYTITNQKNIQVLRRLQELETDVMNLLNGRGVDVFDVDDFEEEVILVPKKDEGQV